MNQAASAHSTNKVSYRSGNLGKRWRARARASGLHLAVSILVAAFVLTWVRFVWYPDPLGEISGVGKVLLILIAVDVSLGPLLTFVAFDRRKKSLCIDLAVIVGLQVAALLYGILAIEAGRPIYVVFVKDRFEVVSSADLKPQDRTAAKGNTAAEFDWFGPRIVAAEMPASAKEREKILFESVSGGRDLHQFPERYRSYESQASLAAETAKGLAELRILNPDSHAVLEAVVARLDLPESRLGFLPVKGPLGDATMLIDASTGAIQGMVGLQPWR